MENLGGPEASPRLELMLGLLVEVYIWGLAGASAEMTAAVAGQMMRILKDNLKWKLRLQLLRVGFAGWDRISCFLQRVGEEEEAVVHRSGSDT